MNKAKKGGAVILGSSKQQAPLSFAPGSRPIVKTVTKPKAKPSSLETTPQVSSRPDQIVRLEQTLRPMSKADIRTRAARSFKQGKVAEMSLADAGMEKDIVRKSPRAKPKHS